MPAYPRKAKGDNSDVPSSPESESSKRPYQHGSYYNGNVRRSAQEMLGEQGSRSLALNQGFTRVSAIPEADSGGTVGQDIGRLKKKHQGSHAQLKD